MLSERQGIAYADSVVQAARATAEAMAQRRTAWACRMYPELKVWSAAERSEALRRAERAYLKRWWPVLTILAVLLIGVPWVLIVNVNHPGKQIPPGLGALGIPLLSLVGIARRAAIRRQLRLLVAPVC